MPRPNLLLIGASVRAAAWSAIRAGFEPWCIDLFADADLRQNAHAVAASAYPADLVDLARAAPPCPWLYTGGLENHPEIVETIANERPTWGNSASVLRAVRSPENVARLLAEKGLPCPAVGDAAIGKPALLKPLRGAGGFGIEHWHGQRVDERHYVQEFIDGDPCSALYLAHLDRTVDFLGATRQLIGASSLHAPFRYAGSIGPLPLKEEVRRRLIELGQVLTTGFRLLGLFGVDFILKGDVPWPVEVNPRYPASAEIIERATGDCIINRLRAAIAEERLPPPNPATEIWGKAVLFGREEFSFPAEGPWRASLESHWSHATMPEFADIPDPGTKIAKGQPILTLFANDKTDMSCESRLRLRASEILKQG